MGWVTSFTAVRLRGAGLELGMDVACAAYALPALGCHAQLQLNIVKTHARMRMARDLTVGHSVANADYHKCIVNENDSQMQLKRDYFVKFRIFTLAMQPTKAGHAVKNSISIFGQPSNTSMPTRPQTDTAA